MVLLNGPWIGVCFGPNKSPFKQFTGLTFALAQEIGSSKKQTGLQFDSFIFLTATVFNNFFIVFRVFGSHSTIFVFFVRLSAFFGILAVFSILFLYNKLDITDILFNVREVVRNNN